MLDLRRDTSDPEELRLFEAALTSFGAIGILYSITIQCKPSFNMFVHMQLNPYTDVKHKILEVARKSYSVQIAVFASFPKPMIRFKTQTPVDPVVPLVSCQFYRFSLIWQTSRDRETDLILIWIQWKFITMLYLN